MARSSSRSRRRRAANVSSRYSTSEAAGRPFMVSRLSPLPRSKSPHLNRYEDLRTWHPIRKFARPLKRRDGGHLRLGVKLSRSPLHVTWHGVRAEGPLGVVICAKRKIRREVIFATGANGRVFRRPRRNLFSGVKCK